MKKETTPLKNEFDLFRLRLSERRERIKAPSFEYIKRKDTKKYFKIALNIVILTFFTLYSRAQINLLQDYTNNTSATIGTYQGIQFKEAGFSGLFTIPNTNGKEFWTVSDRGVNIDAANANSPSCRPTYDKIYGFPNYAPKIHRIRVQGDSIQILQTITMKRPNGTTATGLINPTGFGSTAAEVPSTDTVLNCANFNLKTTAKDAFGIDSEGILVDNDGNFWICEEGGPTIWKLNPAGVVIKRFTPYANLIGAESIDVQIDSVFKYRKNNRGFEGISITPNGKIYAIIQSPILYPTKSIGEGTRIHRILEIDPATNTTRMFAYLNDGIIGTGSDQIRLRDWKIGDMAAINDNTFLVLEAAQRGITDIKRFYLIDITGATNVTSGLYSGVTLEALVDATGLATNSITPVTKTLFMDLLANGWNPTLDKAEGLAIINDSTIAIGNDNDYGQFSPLENGIATATNKKSHVVTYGLNGVNKLSGFQTPCEPSIVWYVDIDGDGFGNAASTFNACNQPIGYVSNATDCDDNNVTITDKFTLQLLHASDFEASVSAVTDAPNFAALVDAFDTAYPNTLIISSGDNILPSPFSNAGEDPLLVTPLKDAYISYYGSNFANNDLRAGIARPDISIMNFLGVEAAVLGNHEFDLGTSELRNIIAGVSSGTSIRWFGAQFPYLSSNLDFSADINLSNIVTSARLVNTAFKSNPTMTAAAIAATPKLAPSTIIIKNGQKIGLVGVTTPILAAISTPGATTIKNPGAGTDDMALLATIVQPYIDALRNEEGIEKIILLAHLQQLNLEKELATYLTGVDIIVSGGSHTLMADANDRMREDDVPAETYPFLTVGADGKPIAIVNTTSEYKYLGRLVVDFDCNNDIVPSSIDANLSGAYAADVQGVEEAWGGVYANAFTTGSKASLVKSLCDAVGGVIASKDGDIYGKASVYLEGRRNFVRTEETNLGNLSADANLWMAKYYDPSISISIKNGGGIRSAIGNVNAVGDQVTLEPTAANPLANKLQGDISRLDIENSLRFNNLLSALTLSATNLKAILEHGVAASGPGQTQGRFPQISGVKFSYDETLVAGSRILNAALVSDDGSIIDTIIKNGVIVGDPLRTFRIVTLNFLAGGGDGYPFNTLGTSRVDLNTLPEQGPAMATFTIAGSEQDAFAEFMKNFHSVDPFSIAETPASEDERIQEAHDRNDCIFAPSASITGTSSILNGMSAALNISFTGASPYIYSYSDGTNTFGPFTEINSSVNISVTPSVTTTYTVTALESALCPATLLGEAVVTVTDNGITAANSSATPYLLPTVQDAQFTSILTVGDEVGGYKMAGIPDGMGAFDNFDGTFTLLMNHEINSTLGITRDHGQIGSFVSKWIINKSNLSVVSGDDLIKTTYLWDIGTSTYVQTPALISRLCSADLPPVSAFYNSATGLGTQERIFMSGEETGPEGRAFGHIASGINEGTSYQLPRLGRFSYENSLASSFESDKTVVISTDDATPGQVYMYVGTKTNTGTEVEKAGLTNGKLYGVAVSGLAVEVSTSFPVAGTPFTMVDLGEVQNLTGATLNTNSIAANVTNFLRPEDGNWDPNNPSDFYFVTTNSFTSPSRMYKLHFTDIANPELGGTITAVLEGTEGQTMMDNMTIDKQGFALIQEDIGNQTPLSKLWQYNLSTDELKQVGKHDPARFITGAAGFLTQDEESSGIIDVQEILGPGMFLCNVQAHYPISGELVEGGQLLAFFNPDTYNASEEINVAGINIFSGNETINDGDVTPVATDNTNFGIVNTGSNVNKQFAIFNSGSLSLIISDINFSGANAGEFSLTGAPSFPWIIAAGTTQNFNVKFSPLAIGERNTTINIVNSDPTESNFDFALSGTGVCPVLTATITANGSTTLCDGSSVVLTSSSAASYLWSTGETTQTITVSTAGSFNVTTTNIFGCTATSSNVTTITSSPIAISAGVTNILCNGSIDGSVSLTVSGGTTPYTYLWSNGNTTANISGLSGGSYTVVVTDAIGCSATNTSNVIEPQQLISDFNGSQLSTCGSGLGFIIANVNGGTLPYNYLWSNGSTANSISGLSAGNYTVTITDANGCSLSQSATVVNSQITSLVTSTTKVSCNGLSDGSICVNNVIGGSLPITYSWNTSPEQTTACATGLPKGFYSVTATDANGCSFTKSGIRVTQPALLVATAFSGSTNATVTPQGGTRPYTYLWSNGKTTRTIGLLNNGTYTVTVTDANGCTATSTVTVGGSGARIATEDIGIVTSDVEGINVYPNPTDNRISILFTSETDQSYTLNIVDITGKTVFSKVDNAIEGDNTTEFDFENLARGIYAISIHTEKSILKSRIVVK